MNRAIWQFDGFYDIVATRFKSENTMAKLSFITDEALEQTVNHILKKAATAKMKIENSIDSNVIDPFAILFEMSGFNLNEQEWLIYEKQRQAQKTLSNAIGHFHPKILGCVEGWTNPKEGADLVSNTHKIIAEIKNKHNTVKGSDLVKNYDTLEKMVMDKGQQYKGYTAYFVEIIPKSAKRYDIEFVPSDKDKGAKRPSNPLIRRVDGQTFYEIVTGVPDALTQLFYVLPDVIKTCSSYEFSNPIFLNDFFKKAFGQL